MTDDTDAQQLALHNEAEAARSAFANNMVFRYCPGPGWPVYVVRDWPAFVELQRCSKLGVAFVRSPTQ